ncbi:MAG: CDP-alcohol phosphatidyltransferase family protein [Anaerolineae bacterium]|nr:CDP-alcohol phosphatidyltransferase family protein [Anaerolineae bacterium]
MNNKSIDQYKTGWKTIPNLFSAVRILIIPILWGYAFQGREFAIGVLLVIAGLSDSLDGYFARKLRQKTALGSKLDSYADFFLYLSALLIFAYFFSAFLKLHIWLLAVTLALAAASLLLGYAKFRRFANLHLYSSKIAAWIVMVFLIPPFFSFEISLSVFYFAVGVYILSTIESIWILLTRSTVDENIGSILFKNNVG